MNSKFYLKKIIKALETFKYDLEEYLNLKELLMDFLEEINN